MQLAWEVVEVAKKLFMRHQDADHQLKASDCLEKLAEIGQEIGNYQQAISDLLECLKLRLEHAPDNDRLIAETHFQLAISYSQTGNASSADASFCHALKRLKDYRSKLELQLSEMNGENDGNKSEVTHLQVQIDEIVGLISEVSERRKECSDTVLKVEEPPAKSIRSDVHVDDITHLIKRKRPNSDASFCEDTKKMKIEGSSREFSPNKSA
ncbi:unnamed protein product [Hydatigera taeniaeformis]|uniref:Tetratricopeptide SHNi-TPR domain-containing protein n=1 Tax=Hydatigena taeniaeformis TaxID=6205 RepID=A0A3P7F068_HYDTA|nr:unnamed protein product [Hydatigera taeniaeformis]